MTEDELNSLSEKVIGCCYTISNALGSGFLERVYENALAHELRKLGLSVEIQKPLHVIYDGVIVGEYFARPYCRRGPSDRAENNQRL